MVRGIAWGLFDFTFALEVCPQFRHLFVVFSDIFTIRIQFRTLTFRRGLFLRGWRSVGRMRFPSFGEFGLASFVIGFSVVFHFAPSLDHGTPLLGRVPTNFIEPS